VVAVARYGQAGALVGGKLKLEQRPVDTAAGAGRRLQSLTAGLQQPVEGVHPRDDRPRFDPGDDGLGHAGLLGELPLREPGSTSGLSKDPSRIHAQMIAEMLSSEASSPVPAVPGHAIAFPAMGEAL
jgi:hypothetical protein